MGKIIGPKFTKSDAARDLLTFVYTEDCIVTLRGMKIPVKYGQSIISQKRLATRWGWSVTKVKNFLLRLDDDYVISLDPSYQTTIITIRNYNKLQNF